MKTNKELEAAVHVFYNPRQDSFCEYYWDRQYKMYRYTIHTKHGTFETGLIGLERLVTCGREEGWEFIGVV